MLCKISTITREAAQRVHSCAILESKFFGSPLHRTKEAYQRIAAGFVQVAAFNIDPSAVWPNDDSSSCRNGKRHSRKPRSGHRYDSLPLHP
jgi:hypothetical protein